MVFDGFWKVFVWVTLVKSVKKGSFFVLFGELWVYCCFLDVVSLTMVGLLDSRVFFYFF